MGKNCFKLSTNFKALRHLPVVPSLPAAMPSIQSSPGDKTPHQSRLEQPQLSSFQFQSISSSLSLPNRQRAFLTTDFLAPLDLLCCIRYHSTFCYRIPISTQRILRLNIAASAGRGNCLMWSIPVLPRFSIHHWSKVNYQDVSVLQGLQAVQSKEAEMRRATSRMYDQTNVL